MAKKKTPAPNTKAPKGSYAVPGTAEKGPAYPVDSLARAKNAIARVEQHGTPAEKKKVYAKVKAKYPALAKRSGVIPTATGTGRHTGQPKGARNKK